jgi:hypothetical protein
MPDTTTETGSASGGEPASAWRRLGWFALIWTGSLFAWLVFAYGLKWVMRLVGISA